MTSPSRGSLSSWTEHQVKRDLTKVCKAIEAACKATGFRTPTKQPLPSTREDPSTQSYLAPPAAAEFGDYFSAALEKQKLASLKKKRRHKRLDPVSRRLDFDDSQEESFFDAQMSHTIQSIQSLTTEEQSGNGREAAGGVSQSSLGSRPSIPDTSESEIRPVKQTPAAAASARKDRADKKARLDDEREKRFMEDDNAHQEAWAVWESLGAEVQTYFPLVVMQENRILNALFRASYTNPHMYCLPNYRTDATYLEVKDEQNTKGIGALKQLLQLALSDHRNAEKELTKATVTDPESGVLVDVLDVDQHYKVVRNLQKRILYIVYFLKLRFFETVGDHSGEVAEIGNALKDIARAPLRCENAVRHSCDFKRYHEMHGEPHPSVTFPSRAELEEQRRQEVVKATVKAAVKQKVQKQKAAQQTQPAKNTAPPRRERGVVSDGQRPGPSGVGRGGGRPPPGGDPPPGGNGGGGNGGRSPRGNDRQEQRDEEENPGHLPHGDDPDDPDDPGDDDGGDIGGDPDDDPDDPGDNDDPGDQSDDPEDRDDDDVEEIRPYREDYGRGYPRMGPAWPYGRHNYWGPPDYGYGGHQVVINPLASISKDDLPVFSDSPDMDFETWKNFLLELVPRLNASGWSDGRKLALLKMRVAGQPKQWISKLRPQHGRAIFQEAISRLEEQYGRGSIDVFVTYKSAMSCPRAKESLESMLAVVQTLTQTHDLMNHQGVGPQDQATIYFIVFATNLCNNVLAKTMIKAWQAKAEATHALGSTASPQDLIEALAKEVRLRQGVVKVQKDVKAISYSSGNNSGKNHNGGQGRNNHNKSGYRGGNQQRSSLPQGFNTNFQSRGSGGSPKKAAPSRAASHTSYNDSSSSSQGTGCPIRDCTMTKKHDLDNCYAFKKMPLESRCRFIEKSKRCRVCLKFRPQHSSKQCKARKCQKCQKPHHTLVHYENNSSGGKGKSPNSKFQVDSYNTVFRCELPICVSFKTLPHKEEGIAGQPKSILMSLVAWIFPAGSQDPSRRIKARILCDTGSDISLIRRQDARALKLPSLGKPGSVPLTVSCSTGTTSPTTMETAHEVDLWSLDMSKCLKNVKTLTVQKIGAPLAPLTFTKEEYPHLKSFKFGETIPSDAPREINLMLSAAYTQDILDTAPVKGKNPNGPTVWPTRLGPSLSGRC